MSSRPEESNMHVDDKDREQTRTLSLGRRLSQLSIQKSKETLHQVGAYLGVTEQDSFLDLWKETVQHRAKSGHIGFPVASALPFFNDDNLGRALQRLEKTLAVIVDTGLETDTKTDIDYFSGEKVQKGLPTAFLSGNLDRQYCQNRYLDSSPRDSTDSGEPLGNKNQALGGYCAGTDIQLAALCTSPVGCCNYIQPVNHNFEEGASKNKTEVISNGTSTYMGLSTHADVAAEATDMYSQHKTETENRNHQHLQLKHLWKLNNTEKAKETMSISEEGGETKDPCKQTAEHLIKSVYRQSKSLLDVKYSDDLSMHQEKRLSDSCLRSLSHTIQNNSSVCFSPGVSMTEYECQQDMSTAKPQLDERIFWKPNHLQGNQSLSDGMRDADIKPLCSIQTDAFTQEPIKSILKQSSSLLVCNEMMQDVHTDTGIENKILSVPSREFIYREVALKQYKALIQMEYEKKCYEVYMTKKRIADKVEEKLELIEEAWMLVRGHLSDPHNDKSMKLETVMSNQKGYPCGAVRKHCRLSSQPKKRKQFEELPEYKPWFITVISMLQLASLVVVCTVGGVTTVGLEPKVQIKDGVQTFGGTETVEHWYIPNIWIGPSTKAIVGIGAMFAPCMREDININVHYANKGYATGDPLGCCEVKTRNIAGTTSQQECKSLTFSIGKWQSGVTCGSRGKGMWHVPHLMRPCCHGVKGQCDLTTHEHCTFLGGFYFEQGPEHCSKVNCLDKVCRMSGLPADSVQPYKPVRPDQWWRLPLSLLYHQGAVHGLVVVTVQYIIGRQIEMMAGWMRISLIYFICGLLGLVVGAIFNPYEAHVGGDGALFGLVGVLFVELIQSWKIIHTPWYELLKLILVALVFLISGTLPSVDNFTFLGGFVFGILCAIIFLPYITFGKWHARWKRILIIVTVPVLLILAALSSFLFSTVQTIADSCQICHLIDCVPYSPTMCNATNLW